MVFAVISEILCFTYYTQIWLLCDIQIIDLLVKIEIYRTLHNVTIFERSIPQITNLADYDVSRIKRNLLERETKEQRRFSVFNKTNLHSEQSRE